MKYSYIVYNLSFLHLFIITERMWFVKSKHYYINRTITLSTVSFGEFQKKKPKLGLSGDYLIFFPVLLVLRAAIAAVSPDFFHSTNGIPTR